MKRKFNLSASLFLLILLSFSFSCESDSGKTEPPKEVLETQTNIAGSGKSIITSSDGDTCSSDYPVDISMVNAWKKAWSDFANDKFLCEKKTDTEAISQEKSKWISRKKLDAFLGQATAEVCPSIRLYFATDTEDSCVYAILSHVDTMCNDFSLSSGNNLSSDSAYLVTKTGQTYFTSSDEVIDGINNWAERIQQDDMGSLEPVKMYTYERSSFEALLVHGDTVINNISLTFGMRRACCDPISGECSDGSSCTDFNNGDNAMIDMVLQALWKDSDEKHHVVGASTNFAQPCPNFCHGNNLTSSGN